MASGALTSAAAIVAMSAGTIVIAAALRGAYRNTIGSRRHTARRLNMLACGQPIAYVESLFGPPALSRHHEHGLIEYVFYTPHALLQLLADEVAGTRRLSITATDPRFRFRVQDLTLEQQDVRLGQSRFWSLPDVPLGRLGWIAAQRFGYVEAHYFGNPGAYQSYLFAFNDAGVGTFDSSAMLEAGAANLQEGVLADSAATQLPASPVDLRSFRSRTTVNTLTIVGALSDPRLSMQMPHGVDLDYVRVFRPSAAKRGQLRRRIERFKRDQR